VCDRYHSKFTSDIDNVQDNDAGHWAPDAVPTSPALELDDIKTEFHPRNRTAPRSIDLKIFAKKRPPVDALRCAAILHAHAALWFFAENLQINRSGGAVRS